jgi:outer membrane lipoprotein-sorting protein
VSPVFAADSPEEILAHVRRKYQEVKDAELSFTRRTRLSVAKIEQNATGSLLLKKGHKYRIEMDDRTVVTDGTTVWSYSKANNQVTVDTYRPDERALTPERILAGAPGDFAASLLGREKLDGIEMVVLKLVPRSGSTPRTGSSARRSWRNPAARKPRTPSTAIPSTAVFPTRALRSPLRKAPTSSICAKEVLWSRISLRVPGPSG